MLQPIIYRELVERSEARRLLDHISLQDYSTLLSFAYHAGSNPRVLSHSPVGPLITAGTFRASSTFLAPVRNIAVLSSIRTVSSFSLTSSSPPDVDLRNGSACPHAFAPNASALAPCSPFLPPPDASTASYVDLDPSSMLVPAARPP